MNETSTPKLTRKNIEERPMCENKSTRVELEIAIEENLQEMMDQQLLTPREAVVKRILHLSKNNLFWF